MNRLNDEKMPKRDTGTATDGEAEEEKDKASDASASEAYALAKTEPDASMLVFYTTVFYHVIRYLRTWLGMILASPEEKLKRDFKRGVIVRFKFSGSAVLEVFPNDDDSLGEMACDIWVTFHLIAFS